MIGRSWTRQVTRKQRIVHARVYVQGVSGHAGEGKGQGHCLARVKGREKGQNGGVTDAWPIITAMKC